MTEQEYQAMRERVAVAIWMESTGGHACNWWEANDDGPTDYEASRFRILADAALFTLGIRELVEAADDMGAKFQGLIDESDGVGGFHLNGDFAPWSEFEWELELDRLRQALSNTTGATP